MKFETKFNIKEHAWCMKKNKPLEVIISSIEIHKTRTNQILIKYNGRDAINPRGWLDHQNLFEEMLFKSKGALVESLFSDGKKCRGENCNAVNGVGHSSACIAEHEDVCLGTAGNAQG